jgi:hypothetical protein
MERAHAHNRGAPASVVDSPFVITARWGCREGLRTEEGPSPPARRSRRMARASRFTHRGWGTRWGTARDHSVHNGYRRCMCWCGSLPWCDLPAAMSRVVHCMRAPAKRRVSDEGRGSSRLSSLGFASLRGARSVLRVQFSSVITDPQPGPPPGVWCA